MATSDADLDAAVRRVLNDLLQQGDPYTALPLLDPSTKLLPPAVMTEFDGLYKEPTDELAEVVAEQGTDLEEVATTVNIGRLSEPELKATFVRFLDENGDPLVGKLVTITVNSTTGEIDDITSEDL